MIKISILLIAITLLSCSDKKVIDTTGISTATEVMEPNTTPTVDIKKYILVQNEKEDRKEDAKQILQLKRSWPLVMQSPSKAGFDTLLSQHFTFYGDGKLLNRQAYITDRTAPSDWQITHVKYDNLILQFFNNTAVLTYKNEVTNENKHTKETEIEYISWADMYVLENNRWKIGAAHVVDFRMEKK